MKKMALHWQVLIALVLGLAYSLLAVKMGWNKFTMDWIDPFGKIFINILKLIAVPLVLFSIISGVTALKDINKLGKMGIKTLVLYVLTTMTAVSVGLIIVNVMQPGTMPDEDVRIENRIEYELWKKANSHIENLDNICLSCLPENEALVQKVMERSQLEKPNEWLEDKLDKARATQESSPLQPVVDVVPSNIFQALADMEMLQIIFFAIFFGIVLISLNPIKVKPMIDFVESTNEVFVKMVDLVMKAMPVFVFALMAGALVKAAGDDVSKLLELLSFLLWYGVAVLVGLLFMIFIFYPSLVSVLIKKMNYRRFMSGISKAQLTAFSTSSSVATLPVTMECVHDNLGVSRRTTSFVLPIGATVNMDGTSLYQAVAVVALAQYHMIDLAFSQQLIIIITATLASIGAAAVPSAGLVLMIIVLESVGLNPAWIALIFPIDRILDMCRTVVNVTGDATVSSLIAQSEGELIYPDQNISDQAE